MPPQNLHLVLLISSLLTASAAAFQIQGELVREAPFPVYGEIAADADYIYATSHPTTQIRVFDRQSLSEIGPIQTPATQPSGLVVGNGILFVSDIRPNGDPLAPSRIFALTLPAGLEAYSFDAPVVGVIALGLDDQGRLLLAGYDNTNECGRFLVYRLDASNGNILEVADAHLDGLEPIIGWHDGHLVLGDAQGVTRVSYFVEGNAGISYFNRVGELVVPGMPNISYRGSAIDGDTLFLAGTPGPFMGSYALLEVKLSSPLDLVVHVDDDACPNIGNGKHDDPFCKIQDAIEASPGQTIVVRPGVYLENINFVGSEVTLTSKDPHDSNLVASTIIDGSAASLPTVTFENAESRASVITGFTILGGEGKVDDFLPAGGGIYCRNSSPTIRGNVIRDNESSLGGGAYIRGGAALVERNQFIHNVATHSGGALKIARSSTAEIRNNLFAGNGSYPPVFGGDGGAIDVFDCPTGAAPLIRNNTFVGSYALAGGAAVSCSAASPILSNNVFAFNRIRPAVWADATSSPTACFNIFWANIGGDYGGSVIPCPTGDQFADPGFEDPGIWTDPLGTPGDFFDDVWSVGNYHLLPTSPCLDAGNPTINPLASELDLTGESRLTGFRMDMGADELRGVHNLMKDVRYPTIQRAIDDALDGDAIVLLPGRYFENLQFDGTNFSLSSLDSTDDTVVKTTIIDGSRSPNPIFGSTITFAGTEDSRCTIEGVTVTGGFGTSVCRNERVGGGILGNGTLATLKHSRIVANVIPHNIPGTFIYAGSRAGGGIFDFDGEISNCEISANRVGIGSDGGAGGGLAHCDGQVMDSIIDNNFSGSSGMGIGGGLYSCNADITRCTISNNFASGQGGGLDNCHGTIRDSLISGNFSEDGGGLGQCNATMINTTFSKNRSECGGAIQNSSGTIDQCVFDENFASNSGGALCGFTGPIRDSEFKDNMTQNGGGAATSSPGPFERCVFDGNMADIGSALETGGSIQILDSVFSNNMAYSGGGAVSFNGQNPLAQIVHNCRFENNEGGAIEVQGHSTPTITRTTFVDNRGDYSGGAITMFGDVDIDDCVFLGNTAVGFDGCCDVPSGAMGGAIANWGRALTIRDSIFAGNVATVLGSNIDFQGGGAIWSDAGSNVEITGTTFFSNVSESVAGAIFQGGGQLSIRNSIFTDNSDSSGTNGTSHIQSVSGNVNLDYSLVLGGWSGTGSDNLDADPFFVDADGLDNLPGTVDDDLRLLPDSPCINRGDPATNIPIDETDVTGIPRLVGCRVDLGAHESDVDQSLGDFNGDNRIDLQDAAFFQMCFDAPTGNPAWATTCLCVFDQDGGGSVDLTDHASFQSAMTGP